MARFKCTACSGSPEDLCQHCQSNARTVAYNEGMLAGLQLARDRFAEEVNGALGELDRFISARRAAYNVRAMTPQAGDIEAGARALCVAVGHDPDRTLPDVTGGGPIPLWTFRRSEAEACIHAALARPEVRELGGAQS